MKRCPHSWGTATSLRSFSFDTLMTSSMLARAIPRHIAPIGMPSSANFGNRYIGNVAYSVSSISPAIRSTGTQTSSATKSLEPEPRRPDTCQLSRISPPSGRKNTRVHFSLCVALLHQFHEYHLISRQRCGTQSPIANDHLFCIHRHRLESPLAPSRYLQKHHLL